jgi:Mg/Co/Ni transporter MgtE
LAIELLKHDQLGIDSEALPRSTIIQQLSVLVAALEDVRPDDGNRSMCELGMNSLRKVLDRLLSQKRLMVPPAASYPSENIEAVFPATNDMEFLSWLGDVDFDGNLWLDGH